MKDKKKTECEKCKACNCEKPACDDCGTTDGVTYTLCPYAMEIYNEEIPLYLCENCYQIRCEDI
jgi:hypothetical protein